MDVVPTLGLPEHTADIAAIIEFLECRGIPTKNTRLARYAQYLKSAKNGPPNEALVFKNSVDSRFRHAIDWHLYVLREIHELMWILRGLKSHVPLGIDEKLNAVASGSDFSALDTNSMSRNVQFELRIASYFCQTGCKVDLSTETDIIAISEKHAFCVECKRVSKLNQLSRRITEALDQLKARMPAQIEGRRAYGIVATDVTKIAFKHDGLTWAQTPDHAREIIQRKLHTIGDTLPSFEQPSNIILYWQQIHIPSLVMHPLTPSTRFSSWFDINLNIDWNAAYAWNHFDKRIFKKANEDDPRAHLRISTPPRIMGRPQA